VPGVHAQLHLFCLRRFFCTATDRKLRSRAPRCSTCSFLALDLVRIVESVSYALYRLPGRANRAKTHCTTTLSFLTTFSTLFPSFSTLLVHSPPLHRIANTYIPIYEFYGLDRSIDRTNRLTTRLVSIHSFLTTFSTFSLPFSPAFMRFQRSKHSLITHINTYRLYALDRPHFGPILPDIGGATSSTYAHSVLLHIHLHSTHTSCPIPTSGLVHCYCCSILHIFHLPFRTLCLGDCPILFSGRWGGSRCCRMGDTVGRWMRNDAHTDLTRQPARTHHSHLTSIL